MVSVLSILQLETKDGGLALRAIAIVAVGGADLADGASELDMRLFFDPNATR
jgi:hypothetical protein